MVKDILHLKTVRNRDFNLVKILWEGNQRRRLKEKFLRSNYQHMATAAVRLKCGNYATETNNFLATKDAKKCRVEGTGQLTS